MTYIILHNLKEILKSDWLKPTCAYSNTLIWLVQNARLLKYSNLIGRYLNALIWLVQNARLLKYSNLIGGKKNDDDVIPIWPSSVALFKGVSPSLFAWFTDDVVDGALDPWSCLTELLFKILFHQNHLGAVQISRDHFGGREGVQ